MQTTSFQLVRNHYGQLVLTDKNGEVACAYLELVYQQTDKIHKVNKFRRFKLSQKIGHQGRNKMGDIWSCRSKDPRESKTSLKATGEIHRTGTDRSKLTASRTTLKMFIASKQTRIASAA